MIAPNSPNANRATNQSARASSQQEETPTLKQLYTGTRSGLIVDQRLPVGGKAVDFKDFKADHAKRSILNERAGLRVTLTPTVTFRAHKSRGCQSNVASSNGPRATSR